MCDWITPHLEVVSPNPGSVLCVCESAPGHPGKFLIPGLVLVLQGGGMVSTCFTELRHRNLIVLFECKVISTS